MDGGDEIDESADPTMGGGEFVEGELGGVWEGEDSEGGSFEGEEDAEREESEGDVSSSTCNGPPGLGNGVIGDVFRNLFVVDRSLLSAVLRRRAGDTIGSVRTNVVGANKTEDHAEDEEEGERKQLGVGGQG